LNPEVLPAPISQLLLPRSRYFLELQHFLFLLPFWLLLALLVLLFCVSFDCASGLRVSSPSSHAAEGRRLLHCFAQLQKQHAA
jgi:hypothetical protein